MGIIKFIPAGAPTDTLYFVGSNTATNTEDDTTSEVTLATVSIPTGKVKTGILVFVSCSAYAKDVSDNPYFIFKIKAGPAGSEVEIAYTQSRLDPPSSGARIWRDALSLVGQTSSPDWSVANNVIVTVAMSAASPDIRAIFEDVVVMGY